MRPILTVFFCLVAGSAFSQERPYFVTYDHYLEEPGNLEVAVATTTGLPRHGHPSYVAPWLEFEYGVAGWWTTELYLEGVAAGGDGSAFTGFRWENRFRPLGAEHQLNPVLYIEYERTNEASRIQKEIVGSGPLPYEPIARLRNERAHELEARLILSSAFGGWNVAENVVFEKNLTEDEGVEFGYSVGASRSLGTLATGNSCRLCRENFMLGAEMYGGLGTSDAIALRKSRHYLAPAASWHVGAGSTIKLSAGFGLTEASDRVLLRVSYAYEFPLGLR